MTEREKRIKKRLIEMDDNRPKVHLVLHPLSEIQEMKKEIERLNNVMQKGEARAVEELKEENERLREALEKASIGIEWYREHDPQAWSDADEEMLNEIKEALNQEGGKS